MLRSANVARNAAVKQFVEKRRIYNQQLHELRKQWTVEHAEKQAILEEEKKKKWAKHVLERAKKLRLKRIATASKKEEVRLGQEKSRLVFRDKLARSQVKINEVRQQQLQRFIQLTDDLNEEKKFWINKDNLETLITPQLFDEPSTTGVVTQRSEYWRWTTAYPNFKRMLAEATEDDEKFDSLEDDLEAFRDEDPTNTIGAHDFLNEIIDSGEDRAKYDDLLKQYLELQSHIGEDEEEYDEDVEDEDGEDASDSDYDGFDVEKYESDTDLTEEEVAARRERQKRRKEYITDSEDEDDDEVDFDDDSEDSDVEVDNDLEDWSDDDNSSDLSDDESDLSEDSDFDSDEDTSDDESDGDDDGRPTKK